MSSPSDLEAQIDNFSATQNPPPITDTATPQLLSSVGPQPQLVNADQRRNGNPPTQQSAGNSQAQRDEKHGDSSDGLWSIYLTEAEKQDTEVIENWKGDTNGILVFTGLFSATVASFIIESYQNLSPNSSDTTKALLAQISQQIVNISNGTPLTSVATQPSQPFTPTASAVRVNVLWFLSLILSLNCALSATLMQQWARRYQELGQSRGTFHRRGRMRAYIFDGIRKFGMARAVATMPTLLHISVFLFFAGLVEFLFPIQATVSYVTLSCIGAFTLAYAILTVLPNIFLSCPYATPLSGSTWRISQLSVIGYLWTILKFEGQYRNSLTTLWRLANQNAPGPDRLRRWRETLEQKVKIRRQWLSQGMRDSIKFSAYNADSVMVTSALAWTLTALDEDKEIEDFAAQVPGFFDSRVVPDATLAVLPLMSHQPNTDPIFGSRLYDLLKTCIPETSILDEEKRKHRLRICMKCLWYFGKAYNELGSSQVLPPYFPDTLANPEITRRIQAEEDSGVRVIGRCFGALIVNKLAADLESRVDPISDEELACLSAILGTTGNHHDVKLLLKQPGAVALLNMISLTFDETGGLVTDKAPSGVLDIVQQTLDILSQTSPSEERAEARLDRPAAIINGSDGTFERILVSRIFDLLDSCIQGASHHTEGVHTSCLRLCLRGLWYFGREFNRLKSFAPLPSYICVAFANSEIANGIGRCNDLVAHEIGRCAGALIVNKLVVDINSNSRTDPIGDVELRCLSTILGIKTSDVTRFLLHPGAIELTNIVFLALADIDSVSTCMPPDVLGAVQQTFAILCQALPDGLNAAMQLDQKDTLMNGTSPLTAEMYLSVLRVWMKNLWHFTRQYNEQADRVPLPSYVCIAFANPEMTRRIHKQHDLAVRVIGRCAEALVINKLAADINSRRLPVNNEELACLSAILGTKSDDVMVLLSRTGAIEFTNIVFLALDEFYFLNLGPVPSYVLDVVQQTSSALRVYQGLHTELKAKIRLNQTNTLMNICAGASSLTGKMYLCILRAWMKNLWHFTRGYSERNEMDLPPFVCIAFTNPEMTRRIRKQRDLAVRVMGRCVEALVVNKLAADIHLRNSPVTNDELACLSAILGTKSRDVMLLLSCPGAIEFTNMVFLALDDSAAFSHGTVPTYVLDVIQPTSSALSRVLPTELNAKMQIDQTNTSMYISNGSSGLTAERYMSLLSEWMKNLWNFTREYNEPESTVSLPSYVCVAFTNPEMSRRIRKQRDLAIHVTGRCVEVLIVNKLAADVNSRSVPIRNYELACLSAILGAQSDDVLLLLSRPGAIELTNLVFLALDDFYTFTLGTVPSYTLDLVRQTFHALYIALPSELNAKMRLNQENTLMNISDGTSSFTAEMYWTLLRVWMQNLWHFIREYVEHRSYSMHLPSYVCAAFTNPEMTLRIRKQRDLAIRVVGRCAEALVVNKLAADIYSRSLSVSNGELTCLSAILGTKSHDMIFLLSCPGAIEFTNTVFLALDNLDSFTLETIPSYLLRVVHQTSSALSRALPPELDAALRLSQTSTLMNLSDGTSSRTAEMYSIVLRVWMKNLWYCTKGCTEPRKSLPSYICVAFTNPEMSRRIHEDRDLAVRAIGRCVEALVVNKLAADINSRSAPASNDELACLSTILGTKIDDVTLLLRHPGAIEFTNMVLLATGDFYSSASASVSLDVADVVQNTFEILSSALPAMMRFDQTKALVKPSDAEIYGAVLHAWMNNLWHITRESNKLGSAEPLPPYICLAFTNPEMTRRIHGESGLDVHVIGRCVEALVVNKLVVDISARNGVASNVERACLSAILGTKSDDVLLLLRHQGAIELTNIVFLAWANIDSSDSASVPLDVLDVVHQTFTILSQVLPAELNIAMQLDQTDALINVPGGTSSLTAEMYRTALRVWTKNLWRFTRDFNERGSMEPLPSYIYIAFANPEMSRRIRKQRDLAVHAIGRCVGALIVNKISADIKSRDGPISNDEMACLSAIFSTERSDMMLLRSCPGAIDFTNIVFLSLSDSYSFAFGTVPSYVLDVVQQTSKALSQALPPELKAKMRLDETNSTNLSDGAPGLVLSFLPYGLKSTSVASFLTTEMYRTTLRGWVQRIWYFMRWYNERGNSVPLPSYVCVAFTNQEMTRRIREQRDLTIREMGRCTEALVVNKLAADFKVLVRGDEIACLSTILGTNSDTVKLLLRYPGAVELTNVIFLTLDGLDDDSPALDDLNDPSPNLDDSSPGTVPTYLLDVLQQTSSSLYHDIPPQLKAMIRLKDTLANLTGSDRTSYLKSNIYMTVLHESTKSIWHLTRGDTGNEHVLPSSVYIAFTNPEMTRRISKQHDLAVRAIGRCIGALVVNRLVADINSRNIPASDVELACLSAILGTQSDDVGLCLRQPGTIQLVNLASLALGDASSFQADQMLPDTHSLFQKTLAIVSHALPAQSTTPQLLLDEVVALANVSDDNFERTIVSHHHSLLMMCVQGTSSLMEDPTICLRTILRSLWHFGKAYLQKSAPLPSYFHLLLARPEIIRHLRTERDPVARITGYCFGALVVNKLVDALESPISRSGGVRDSYLSCISAVIGAEHREVFLFPHRIRVINFWKIVSVMSGEVHAFSSAAGMPADELNMVQDTLSILANRLHDHLFVTGGPPMDQWRSVQEEYSQVVNELSSDRLKNEPEKTLVRLRQILERLLPGVEFPQDTEMQDLDYPEGIR